ncbi:unnamed protein product [Didymodactylos carnosus]|nr:unnamed protein product [Didymodactylos carnosus]
MNTTLLNQCSGNIFTSPQQLLQFIQRLEQDQQFIQRVSSSRETDCNLTYQLSHLAQSTSLNTVSTPQLDARHFSRLTCCYYCNNHGHFSRCCPERPKRTTRKSNPNLCYKKDSFPQPTTEELLQRLGGNRYFTKLDLKSGYFQIPILEHDKEKTAFVTQDGLWEFNVLPQGVMNGPPTFQRVMHNLIGNGRWDYVVVYLDDILIFSKTLDEHKCHLNEILTILSQANFQLHPEKCTIAVEEIDYLSHIVNKDRILLSPEKIRAIVELSPPHTLNEANEFIGKLNWYRKFIPHFAEIAAPIHKVTNKTKKTKHEFHWHDEQQVAFDRFKRILTSEPLFLQYPDPTSPFILSTDASVIGISGILRQNTSQGTRICYCKSRTLTDTEKRYDPLEREALAMYWCIKELRQYIGDSAFPIETDSEPLINFHKKQIDNKRIMHWLFKLQDIIPQITEVKHLNRDKNTGPDYLSKHPVVSASSSHLPITLDNNNDWPPGIETWEIKPPRTLSYLTRLNAVITHQQTKKQASTTSSITPIFPPASSTLSSTILSSPSSSPLFDFSLDRIRTEQSIDHEILEKLKLVQLDPSKHSFVIKDGVLFKLIPRGKTNLRLPYVPKTVIKDILFTHHDHPMAGHFGVERTWRNIKNKYYWPNMKESIEKYIRSRTECSKFNIQRQKPPGLLQPISPPSEVFQVLGLDWWGPAPVSSNENKYVLVITDRLSGYVIAKASTNNTAQATAQILMDNVILIHGTPEKIITDLGQHSYMMANIHI